MYGRRRENQFGKKINNFRELILINLTRIDN